MVDPSEGRIWQPGKNKEKYGRPKLMAILSLLVQAKGNPATKPANLEPTPFMLNSKCSHRFIVVLPNASNTDNQDIKILADGISEEIIDVLTRTPELRVISRPSSFSLKGDIESG